MAINYVAFKNSAGETFSFNELKVFDTSLILNKKNFYESSLVITSSTSNSSVVFTKPAGRLDTNENRIFVSSLRSYSTWNTSGGFITSARAFRIYADDFSMSNNYNTYVCTNIGSTTSTLTIPGGSQLSFVSDMYTGSYVDYSDGLAVLSRDEATKTMRGASRIFLTADVITLHMVESGRNTSYDSRVLSVYVISKSALDTYLGTVTSLTAAASELTYNEVKYTDVNHPVVTIGLLYNSSYSRNNINYPVFEKAYSYDLTANTFSFNSGLQTRSGSIEGYNLDAIPLNINLASGSDYTTAPTDKALFIGNTRNWVGSFYTSYEECYWGDGGKRAYRYYPNTSGCYETVNFTITDSGVLNFLTSNNSYFQTSVIDEATGLYLYTDGGYINRSAPYYVAGSTISSIILSSSETYKGTITDTTSTVDAYFLLTDEDVFARVSVPYEIIYDVTSEVNASGLFSDFYTSGTSTWRSVGTLRTTETHTVNTWTDTKTSGGFTAYTVSTVKYSSIETNYRNELISAETFSASRSSYITSSYVTVSIQASSTTTNYEVTSTVIDSENYTYLTAFYGSLIGNNVNTTSWINSAIMSIYSDFSRTLTYKTFGYPGAVTTIVVQSIDSAATTSLTSASISRMIREASSTIYTLSLIHI